MAAAERDTGGGEAFLAKLERYGASQWQPVTFLERGASLDFTTPMLLGARVRPLDKPGGSGTGAATLELVVPNPSGGEGVYILPWGALADLCTPSLHDRQLWGRVGDMRGPTPRRMREAARTVAAEGYAGREAAKAAAEALAREREKRTATQYFLMLRLVRQAEPPNPNATPPEREQPEVLARRVRAAIAAHLADAAGGPDAAYRALEDIAEVLQPVGLPGDPTRAPLPALVVELEAMARTLTGGGGGGDGADEVDRACATLVARSAEPTLALARAVLDEAQGLAADIPALLRRWLADPHDVRRITARPDWLLDGWETILALWREEGGAALRDMATLVPVVPQEAHGWAGEAGLRWQDERSSALRRRAVRAGEDWRTGRLLEIQRRNERLRARAA